MVTKHLGDSHLGDSSRRLGGIIHTENYNRRTKNPTLPALCFTSVISFYLLSFSTAILAAHQTELNQTMPHVGERDIFENACPKFGVTLVKNRDPKTTHFQCFPTTLKPNIFRIKHDIDKLGERHWKLQRVPYDNPKSYKLWSTNSLI